MKKSGQPRNKWPAKATFCKEHNTKDVLGTVEDIYLNEDDDWIWANIRSKRDTTNRLNSDLFKSGIRGVSMGYYLEGKNRPYKEIEEISLVKHPDFLNSRIKVIHSADSGFFLPLFPNMDPESQQQQQDQPSTELSDDISTDPVDLNDFNSLTDEQKKTFLERARQLELKEEENKRKKEQEEASQALEANADQFMNGVNALVDNLEADQDNKDKIGGRFIQEALDNKLFGETIKLAETAINKEKARVAELERKNKEIIQQMASMQNNAKNAKISSARNNSSFGSSSSSRPVKVSHGANNNNMSSSQNLFSILNRKRASGTSSSSSTINNKRDHSEISAPSGNDEPDGPTDEPLQKVSHSAFSNFHPDMQYIEPASGFSLAGLIVPPSSSSSSETQRILVTHSSTPTSFTAVGTSSSPSISHSIEYIQGDVNQVSLSLLDNVLRNKRDFGDAWDPAKISNSLLATNPKAYAQIVGQKNAHGYHRSNRDEGIFGHQSEAFKHVFADPNSPSINPYHRKDAAYTSKYHVSIDDYGKRQFLQD